MFFELKGRQIKDMIITSCMDSIYLSHTVNSLCSCFCIYKNFVSYTIFSMYICYYSLKVGYYVYTQAETCSRYMETKWLFINCCVWLHGKSKTFLP